MPGGRLTFVQDEPSLYSVNLWGVHTDPKTGAVSSGPTKLTNWFGFVPWFPSVSKDGTRLAMTRARDWYDLYIGELKDHGLHMDSAKRVGLTQSFDFPNTWTLDSKSLIFSSDRNRTGQIFRQHLNQDSAELLVQGLNDYSEDARLTPDGTWILYWSHAERDPSIGSPIELKRVPSSGGASEAVLKTPSSPMIRVDCPRNPPASCVFSHDEQDQMVFYALDPLHGLGKELARTKTGSVDHLSLTISPDGLSIAISGSGQLFGGIRIIDLGNQKERQVPLPEGLRYLTSLAWTADGKALLACAYRQTNSHPILRIELDGKIHLLEDRGIHAVANLVPSPDGQHLAFCQRTLENNVWLLENF